MNVKIQAIEFLNPKQTARSFTGLIGSSYMSHRCASITNEYESRESTVLKLNFAVILRQFFNPTICYVLLLQEYILSNDCHFSDSATFSLQNSYPLPQLSGLLLNTKADTNAKAEPRRLVYCVYFIYLLEDDGIESFFTFAWIPRVTFNDANNWSC